MFTFMCRSENTKSACRCSLNDAVGVGDGPNLKFSELTMVLCFFSLTLHIYTHNFQKLKSEITLTIPLKFKLVSVSRFCPLAI